MVNTSNVKVTVFLSETDLDDQELQAEVENLLPQIREVDGVKEADLVEVEEAPRGSKAVSGFLLGMLKAVVDPASVKALFGFLSDRLSGKTIELEVEANGKKLKVKASNKAEFELAIQKAQDFIKASVV